MRTPADLPRVLLIITVVWIVLSPVFFLNDDRWRGGPAGDPATPCIENPAFVVALFGPGHCAAFRLFYRIVGPPTAIWAAFGIVLLLGRRSPGSAR